MLALADSYLTLAALLVLCGLLLAPSTVVGSTLLDTVAPRGTVTEAFAAMVMGIVAGTAIGNALGGALVESASFEVAGAGRGRDRGGGCGVRAGAAPQPDLTSAARWIVSPSGR